MTFRDESEVTTLHAQRPEKYFRKRRGDIVSYPGHDKIIRG